MSCHASLALCLSISHLFSLKLLLLSIFLLCLSFFFSLLFSLSHSSPSFFTPALPPSAKYLLTSQFLSREGEVLLLLLLIPSLSILPLIPLVVPSLHSICVINCFFVLILFYFTFIGVFAVRASVRTCPCPHPWTQRTQRKVSVQ
jgi:hypothetical protein